MNAALSQANTLPRLPKTALPMAFVALAALYITNPHWILPVSAVLLGAAQFSATRLDNETPLIRVGRYVLFAILGFGAYLRFTSESADSADANLAYLAGQLCAAELAIQAWLRRPAGGSNLPAAVLLSTMVFLAASNTFDNRFVPVMTPLFFLCLGVALRNYASFEGVKRHSIIGSLAGGWYSGHLLRQGWTVDRARKRAILLGAMLTMPGFLGAVTAGSPLVAVLSIAVVLAGFQVAINNIQTLPSDYFAGPLVGTVAGIGGMGAVAGVLVFSTWLVPVLSKISYTPVFVMAALLVPVAIGSLFLLGGEIRRVDDPAGTATSK